MCASKQGGQHALRRHDGEEQEEEEEEEEREEEEEEERGIFIVRCECMRSSFSGIV